MRSLYLILGLMGFWSIFLTIIFRLEKRTVWPFSELQPSLPSEDPNGYGARWVQDAIASGFTMLGWSRDSRGTTYSVSYGLLVSAQRDVFAVIGTGRILRMPMEATWLYTPTCDGRCFYSTDKQSGVQIDLSRNWTNQLAPSGRFRDLLQQHRDWLRENQVIPRSFTEGNEMADLRRVREEHFRAMERAGLIDFTDVTGSHFYFTLLGAARTAIWSYFLGMARQLSVGKFPRSA